MPELPELHGMASVINSHAKGRTFVKCLKSTVSKQAKVKAPSAVFTISAESRGKELMVTLAPSDVSGSCVYILCGMGMTGFWQASPSLKEAHKHAHLKFVASDDTVLSFVDPWRFGTWRSQKTAEWPPDRGPCPVKEHLAFRRKVLDAVAAKPKSFDGKPICQVLHDQTLFNGIGNYLRAEVLHRAAVPPFASSLEALGSLCPEIPAQGATDLLTLCRDVPNEVIALNLTKYQGEDGRFQKWLRAYSQEGASWAVDKQKRRVWYHGPPGKLLAKFASRTSETELPKTSSERSIRKRPASAIARVAPASKRSKVSKKPAGAVLQPVLKKPASRRGKPAYNGA